MGKQNTLHSVHVQRNDTAENWNTANPVLLKGEMGVESDTRKFKFGDGVSKWQELDYADKTLDDAIKAEAARATQRENAIEAAYKAADTAEQSRAEAQEAAIRGELQAGDTETLKQGKAYTDARETQIRKDYVAADTGALTAAKDYTDTRETAIRSDMTAGDAKTLDDAKKHAETKIAELVGSAPEALNTLEEIAAKLKEDEGATEAMLQQIGEKADTTYVNAELAKKADASHTHAEYATKTELETKANTADVVKNTMAVKATKLEAGQEPTIEYDKTENILTVGIPKGDTGATGAAGAAGAKGDTGAAAGFGAPTATVDSGIGTPGVTVTATGPDTAKVFKFAFTNLKGATGAQGPTGPAGKDGATGPAGAAGAAGAKGDTGAAAGFGAPTATVDSGIGTPGVTVTATGPDTAKVFKFAFTNLKGEKGAAGAQGATPTISATASVDSTSGTPSVKVTKSGDSLTPVFNFAFSGLKGEEPSTDLLEIAFQDLEARVNQLEAKIGDIESALDAINGELIEGAITGREEGELSKG